jgi:hypothetical protein
MYDEKRLDYVSEAVKYLIDHLGPEDRASIVVLRTKPLWWPLRISYSKIRCV